MNAFRGGARRLLRRGLVFLCVCLFPASTSLSYAEARKSVTKRPAKKSKISHSPAYAPIVSDMLPLVKASDVRGDLNAKAGQPTAAERVVRDFSFVGDYFQGDFPTVPPGWVSSSKKPWQALLYGRPLAVKRPEPTFYTAMYSLPQLHYFIGTDPILNDINAVVNFWQHERYQSTLELLQLMKTKYANRPPTDALALVYKMLRAYFHFQLSANPTIKVTLDPQGEKTPIGVSDHFSVMQSAFGDLLLAFDFGRIASVETNVDNNLYQAFFTQEPITFEMGVLKQGKINRPQFIDKPIDPLVWLRSVMIHSLWNAALNFRMYEMWDSYFDAGDKFIEVHKLLHRSLVDKPNKTSSLIKPKLGRVSEPYWFVPRNYVDLEATFHIVSAITFRKSDDPHEMVLSSARAIKPKVSEELNAIAFQLAADVYFDLANLEQARKIYAWAEIVAPEYEKIQPRGLFFGAESSFWQGDFVRAKKAYQRFIELVGDREFGPWARFRLAEIAHIQNKDEETKQAYEEIVRLYPAHSVARDAKVRLFCANVDSLTPQALQKAYDDVSAAIADAPDFLKSQAKACQLKKDLKDLASGASPARAAIVEQSQKQIQAIEDYEKEFPDTDFKQLFAERSRKLRLSQAMLLSSQNKCSDLVMFYKKFEGGLLGLKKDDRLTLASLKWDENDQIALLRCAVLIEDFRFLKRFEKTTAYKDGGDVKKHYLAFRQKKTEANILKLYKAIKEESRGQWRRVLTVREETKNNLVRDAQFWKILSMKAVLDFDLSKRPVEKRLFRKVVIADVLAQPRLVRESDMLCNWTLAESPSFTNGQWDKIARVFETTEFLEVALENDVIHQSECTDALIQEVFASALKKPSSFRDERILLPYLKKQGIQLASEQWLAYAQRLVREKGVYNKDVVDIYKKLRDEAPEPLVKDAARLWLENNHGPESPFL